MKAVPVLFCLALAHGITASIFKHEDPQVDNLEVQRLEYIDQYQRQHRNLPSETARRYQQRVHHREEERDQLRTQPQDQERDQQRQQQGSYQRDEKRHQQPAQQREQLRHQPDQRQVDRETQYQNQQWEQHRQYSQDSQPEHYQYKYEEQAYNDQYQPSVEQSQEQYAPKTHVKRSHHKKAYQQSESASSESSQTSHESRERRQYYDNKKSRTENQKWESLQDTVKSQETQNSANSEEIQRDVLKMVIGPNASVQEKEEIEKIFSDAQNAMKHISQEDKVRFHQTYESAKQQDNEDAELNATQLAQKHQYPVEEHMIKTDDGYELTLFRIPPKQMQIRDVQKKPVVFLMHGIDGSADDWLLMGPHKSLAYLLSDAGYDVWLGNARGNKYSRKHVSKHPAVPDFWQYSTDEIALHDLPAMIDYALKTTKQEKLYYIGHSQGTTAFFALTATRPEYNDKIIMMYALSPVVYMTNVRSPLFRMIAPTSKFSNRLQHQLGNGPFTPSKDLIKTVGGAMLEKEIGCTKVSSHPSFVMAGVDVDNLDANLIPVVMRHLPAGTSTKVIKHYAQAVSSQEFRKFDHGPKINKKVYGKEQPPKYEMEKVQAPVTLFYSEEDWLAHPKDVERLVKELPNVKETHKVADKHFSHMDFQFSKKAPEMVYRQLIESMQNNQ